jgi:hypothetical protein
VARTYITTNNSRGSTVTAMSPTYAHIRGWDAGVMIQAILIKDKPDRFDVYMSTGSNGSSSTYLGSVVETPEGPEWRNFND